jgi:hypothetical protein
MVASVTVFLGRLVLQLGQGHGQGRRVIGVGRRGEAQQAHGHFGLGLQLGHHVLAAHGDRTGFRVQATTGAQLGALTTIDDFHHHRLALADGDRWP